MAWPKISSALSNSHESDPRSYSTLQCDTTPRNSLESCLDTDEEKMLTTEFVGSCPTWKRILKLLFASPADGATTRGDTAWLDGLRGCAALLVVLSHWSDFAGTFWSPVYGARCVWPDKHEVYTQWYRLPLFRWIFQSADAAVAVFFIISGFVLTRRPLQILRNGTYDEFVAVVSSSAIRRVPRLWIPTTICSFTGMILIKQGLRRQYMYSKPESTSSLMELRTWAEESLQMLSPLAILGNPLKTSQYEFTLWTIPYEYLGSMACFLLLIMIAKVKNTWYRKAFLIFISIHCMLYRKTCHLALFFVGMTFADFSLDDTMIAQPSSRWAKYLYLFITNAVAVMSLWLIQVPKQTTVTSPFTTPGYDFLWKLVSSDTVERFWTSIGAILIFAVAPRIVWLRRSLESDFCQFLGRISFSLYLVHFQFSDLVAKPRFSTWVASHAQNDGVFVAIFVSLLYWMTMLPTCFFVSAWHERWIDRGAIRFSKWLYSRLSS